MGMEMEQNADSSNVSSLLLSDKDSLSLNEGMIKQHQTQI